MNTPQGLIILLHNGFAKIPISEALESLPKEWHGLHREMIEINYSELLQLEKLYDVGYDQFALEHRRQFTNEITPLLNAHPDYKIVYFGLAPIPLCVDLGHLFCNYRDISIYQKHHVTKEWFVNLVAGDSKENNIVTTGLPHKSQKGLSDALIRMSISHSINPDDTFELLPNAAEIDIAIEQPDEDAINFESKMMEAGEAIKHVLDDLSSNRSSLEKIHLFASITCGVAFLIGTKISPNNHTYIQTYQFSRTKDPKYKKALLIKARLNPERKISDDDKRVAQELRQLSNEELTIQIKLYTQHNEDMSSGRGWIKGVIPKLDDKIIMNTAFWKSLPALYETSLKGDSFDFDAEIINDGFYWRMNKWYVDDNFFISLNKRLTKKEDILMAVRLFLFHEAVHYSRHKLTDITSVNIGSFPKVLETADYQADVYGIMNEYGYHVKMIGEIEKPREFFLEAIKVATETMWSFDDNGIPLEEIQIRRLNRYMIWYWQYARIEKEGDSLDKIISIFEQKPVIELNGLKTKEENNRFFFELEKRKDQPLELGIFHNNELIRDGSASNMLLDNLVKGVKEMNGDMILTIMRSFVSR